LKALTLILALCCGACTTVPLRKAHASDVQSISPPLDGNHQVQALALPVSKGWATWYGGKRWHGRRTASGERFDQQALTAAHLTLPLGTRVRVVNLANGREVWVRINDRGPKSEKYIIDVSETAAERLGMRRAGRARVALYFSEAEHTPSRH
jgi:rare lipoprotein A